MGGVLRALHNGVEAVEYAIERDAEKCCLGPSGSILKCLAT